VIAKLLAGAAIGGGVAFQIGHFAEHAYQFGHWVLVDRTKPWMSNAADWLVRQIGMAVDCGSKMGMELLHLNGNAIFLATLAGLLWLMPRSRDMRWALGIEAFHLTEHIMLVASVGLLGKPIGWSTLFGFAPQGFSANAAVGYRVGWHFMLNLIPSVLMMRALMPYLNVRRLGLT
jgi:hypothetical protein